MRIPYTPKWLDVLLVAAVLCASSAVRAQSQRWGSLGTGDGQFGSPEGIAVDSAGNVYVADSDNQRIQKFASDGQFLSKWGSSGTGDGQFASPRSLTIGPGENIYVVDCDNFRIQVFTGDGAFITKWGSHGTGDGQFGGGGQFVYPGGIAVGLHGEVYVADTANHRIEKFTSNGTFIGKWGVQGYGDGEFRGPFGVAVAPDGSVCVADHANSRIQKFTPDGTFVSKFGSFPENVDFFPRGLAIDRCGLIHVRVENASGADMEDFSPDGTFLRRWVLYSGDGYMADYINGVAVSLTGNVYVTMYQSGGYPDGAPPPPACDAEMFPYDCQVPVDVQDLQAVASNGRVLLGWRLSTGSREGLLGVRVRRAVAEPGPYEALGTSPLEPAATMSFEDTDVAVGHEYWYQLALLSRDGNQALMAPIHVRVSAARSGRIALQPIDTTGDGPVQIQYTVALSHTPVRLGIFDVLGREVRLLDQGFREPGNYVRSWDRRDTSGLETLRGVYVVQLKAGAVTATRKLILLHR
jgi:DNA-binding beta-propeller fold protein YncE